MLRYLAESKMIRIHRTDDDHIDAEPDHTPEVDLDRQGNIRTIANAHLVYKRKNEQNTYDELWIYKRNSLVKKTDLTYRAIIAGTDIPRGSTFSEDGEQSVSVWEVGPPEAIIVFVNIKGLSN